MALFGKAVVAIWNDILPEGRENFIEWHNREHIPERIAITGFLRGRRYVAEYGNPEYFTLYEAADGAVLTGPAYLDRLNSPTVWTKQSTADFRNTVRGICETAYSHGSGDGGFILTLRFHAEDARGTALEEKIISCLEVIGRLKGVTGAHLCIADSVASSIETTERKNRQVDVPNWIVLIEGSSTATVDAAGTELTRIISSEPGIDALKKALYRLEFSLVDYPMKATTVERKTS